jgi:hypothetical protein
LSYKTLKLHSYARKRRKAYRLMTQKGGFSFGDRGGIVALPMAAVVVRRGKEGRARTMQTLEDLLPSEDTKLEGRTYSEFTPDELKTIRQLAKTLPWTWKVEHYIDRQSDVFMADLHPPAEMHWMPQFSIEHTERGFIASMASGAPRGHIKPTEYPAGDLAIGATIPEVFDAIAQRLASLCAVWNIRPAAATLQKAA